jgi:ankyrin repeat protein
MNYKFCLSSDCGTTHEIEINEENITWESFINLVQEKLKMSKVTYLELADHSLSRIGERIRDLDDFQYALKCYQDGMIFKVYGKLAVSSGIVVTKKSSKSPRLQEASLDSLLTPPTTSTYNPLDDFQNNSLRKSSSSSLVPREDLSLTSPREAQTIVKKSRQLRSTFSTASSESSSSDVPSETLSPRTPYSTSVYVSSRQKANSQTAQTEKIHLEDQQVPMKETTSIHEESNLDRPLQQEFTPPSVEPTQEESNPPPNNEVLEDHVHEEFLHPACSLKEESNDPIPPVETDENPIREEDFENPDIPSEQEVQSLVNLEIQPENHKVLPPEPQPLISIPKISNIEDFRRKETEKLSMHQDKVLPAPPAPTLSQQEDRTTEPPKDLRKTEIEKFSSQHSTLPALKFSHQEDITREPPKAEEQEITLDRFANTLSLDFSSSLQSILAGLSRLEDTIGSSSLEEGSSYTEPISISQISHFPSSSFDFDFKDPSRPNMASLKTSAELEAERLEQEALKAKAKQEEEAQRLREMMERERKAVLENERIEQQNNLKSKNQNQTIQFTLFTNTTQSASLTIPDHAEWMELIDTVGKHFDIEPTSITHFVLLDEDDDEISGKLNEPNKFWKIFEKYSTLSGRYFSVHYDSKLVKRDKAPPVPVPVIQSPPPPVVVESEEETQIDDRKQQISLYKRDRQQVKPTQQQVLNTQTEPPSPPRHVEVKEFPPPIVEEESHELPIPLEEEVYNFRLSTDYIDEQNSIRIPKNASWEILTSLLLNQLKNITPAQKLTSTVSKISLFDDDGDELVGNIDNEDSFWKVINSRYKKNQTIFVVNLLTTAAAAAATSSSSSSSLSKKNPPSPSGDSHPIFCRLFGTKTQQKEIILIPISSNWEQLNEVICDHWKLNSSLQKISSISLFDNENDELFGGITNEKKFWKCYKTHYNKLYTDFVFTLIDSTPTLTPIPTAAATAATVIVNPSSPATTAAAAPPPWTSLSLSKTKQNKRERKKEISEENSENILSLRFRLFDQNNEMIETIGIPLNASWDVLVSSLLSHFQLDPDESQVDHIDLVDHEGDLYGTFTKEQKFWKSVQTTYKKSSDLFYVLTVNVTAMRREIESSPLVSEPITTVKSIPLNFRLRVAANDDDDASVPANSVTEINIPEQATWIEITKTIIKHFNYGERSVINSMELVDEDGDDLVGRILNEKKFWKVVATGYSLDTIFIVDMNVVKPSPPLPLPTPPSKSLVTSKRSKTSSSSSVTEKLPSPVTTKSSSLLSKPPPDSVPQADGRPIYFCSSLQNFSNKMILTIPDQASWEEIDQILQHSFDLKNKPESVATLSAMRLIDDDGDEYCDVITDSKKFWKVLNSRYTHSGDLSFTFTWTTTTTNPNGLKVEKKKKDKTEDNISPHPKPPHTQQQQQQLQPTRSLPFRLHNEDLSASTMIQIPEQASWSVITQSINQTYNFPASTVITHVDLLDEEGDEITVGIHNETKFWKFIHKNQKLDFVILIWFNLPPLGMGGDALEQEEEDEREEEEETLEVEEESPEEQPPAIIPLYFRLSTDSLTDKGVVEIPWNANWEEICLCLIEFFEIDPKNFKIDSLSLVDDDGHNRLTKITKPNHFWQIIQTDYHFDSMVFVIFLTSLRLQFSFQFQWKSQILEIGIYDKSNWNEICDVLIQQFSPSSSSTSVSIGSLSLMDEDGDEIFSKISDDRKFWKAAKSKYKKNETVFVILMSAATEMTKSTSSSSLLSSSLDSPTTTHSSASSSITSTSKSNVIASAAATTAPTPSAPTTVVIKKHKLHQSQQPPQPQPQDQIRNSTSSSSESSKPPPPSTTSLSTSRAIPQVDPAKFEGRYVPLSFKLSTDEIDDEISISIPAMGSWDQICNAILQSLPESSGASTIDRLDLLDDDGIVLLNNIVSSSKFWKACLEQYRESETLFNIFIHPLDPGLGMATSSVKPDTSRPSHVATGATTKKSGSRGNKKSKSSEVTFETFLSACGENNVGLVNEIIQQHVVNITSVDDRGLSASHVAAINGSLDVMKILLEYSNTFLTLRDQEGMTSLHYACEVNQTDVVQYLIDSGADVTVRNKMGMTCLHYIAINGNMELATAYVAENMINVATNSGLTLLHFAADMGHVAMVKYLLLKHANVHCRDDEGLIPLHLACISNHLDCVKVLMTIGSSYCNLRDDEGMSCLLHACKEGNLEIVKYLCDPSSHGSGASASGGNQGNLLARNDHYESCLHLACISGSLPLVKYLLQKKVDINARNDKNETPLEVASKIGNDVIANWLEDRGGVMRPETKDEMMTRKQIDMKSEKAIRAFEAEELLNIEK